MTFPALTQIEWQRSARLVQNTGVLGCQRLLGKRVRVLQERKRERKRKRKTTIIRQETHIQRLLGKRVLQVHACIMTAILRQESASKYGRQPY